MNQYELIATQGFLAEKLLIPQKRQAQDNNELLSLRRHVGQQIGFSWDFLVDLILAFIFFQDKLTNAARAKARNSASHRNPLNARCLDRPVCCCVSHSWWQRACMQTAFGRTVRNQGSLACILGFTRSKSLWSLILR